MRALFLCSLLLLAAAACGSLRELAPETAAARINRSDDYKAEACAISERYAQRLGEYDWSAAAPLTPLDAAEIRHMQAVFALRPALSCRLKADKFFYDLDGMALYELALAVGAMEEAYAALPPGGALADCEQCTLPEYAASNGLLVGYYKQAPFVAARERHAGRFNALCLDVEHAAENAEAVEAHALHGEPRLNPLYTRHGGCDAVWRAAYAAAAGTCTHYGETAYLVCPQGIWTTEPAPARPVTYRPQGYARIDPFAGGFVVALNDGAYDVYWLEQGVLQHEAGTRASPPRIGDVNGDLRTDVRMGDLLVLGKRDGTGERTSVAAFEATAEAAEAARRRARVEASFTVLPLADVERLLGGEYANHAVLLDRASDLSYEWWEATRAAQRSTLELVEVYWHALLWNRLTEKHAVDETYLAGLLQATAPTRLAERRSELAALRARGDGDGLLAACNALRDDADHVVAELEAVQAGTAQAMKSLAPLWVRYHGRPADTAPIDAAVEAGHASRDAATAMRQAACL